MAALVVHMRRIRNRGVTSHGWTRTVNLENRALCGGELTSYDIRESSARTTGGLDRLSQSIASLGRKFCPTCEDLRRQDLEIQAIYKRGIRV